MVFLNRLWDEFPRSRQIVAALEIMGRIYIQLKEYDKALKVYRRLKSEQGLVGEMAELRIRDIEVFTREK